MHDGDDELRDIHQQWGSGPDPEELREAIAAYFKAQAGGYRSTVEEVIQHGKAVKSEGTRD